MRKLAILLLVLLAACTAPPEDVAKAEIQEEVLPPGEDTEEVLEVAREEVAIDMETSSFEFEGYGPGKSHVGTFSDITGVLFVQDGEVVGGSGVVNADSVDTGISGLDTHLKAADFFDVENCETIEFTSSSYDGETMTGDLTFHCITKEVSFPAEVSENGIKADFVLDTTPFEMENNKVNKEVRISFEFK